jgi:hypothetical protein
MVYYRDALDSIERTMYPKERTLLFLQAQKNLIDIQKNEYNYSTGSHHIKTKMVDLEEKRIHLNNREKSLYENPSDEYNSNSTPSLFDETQPKSSNWCGCFGKIQENDVESAFNLDEFNHISTDNTTPDDTTPDDTTPDDTTTDDIQLQQLQSIMNQNNQKK